MNITTMAQADETIPAPQTPAEIAIHIGYLRRDIAGVSEKQESNFKEIRDAIANLGEHFIGEQEFRPVAETVASHSKEIGTIRTWKDNLQGRMIGFAAGISAASASGAAVLVKIFGG